VAFREQAEIRVFECRISAIGDNSVARLSGNSGRERICGRALPVLRPFASLTHSGYVDENGSNPTGSRSDTLYRKRTISRKSIKESV